MRRWVNDLGMILLAFVLAVVVWIVAVQEENPIERGEYTEAIPVQVRNQPARTTFLPAGFDESVHFTILAPQSSWQDLRPDKFDAWIDLKDQVPGDYEVPVQYDCTDANVRVLELRPSTVLVRLKEEITRTVPVQIQLYGSPATGYKINADEVIIKPETVTVTGPASIVNQVTKATLDFYLREDTKETFTGSRSVSVRQANGDAVGSNFVTIDPPTVQITVPVVHETGFGDAIVRPKLVGNVAEGYWVRDVTVDPITVLLGGDPDVVSKIGGVVETTPLDITGATSDVVERLALDLPEGASPVGIQGVKVTVSVAPQQGSVTVTRRPVVRGLSTDLVAQVTPEEVEITVIGPLPRLNVLTDEDIYVYVELVDRTAGQYRIDLTSLVPEGLQVLAISPASVNVEITAVTPTPMPTFTPTSTPTSTPTIEPTTVLTGTATITGTPGSVATITPTGTRITTSTTKLTPGPATTSSLTPAPRPVVTPTGEIE